MVDIIQSQGLQSEYSNRPKSSMSSREFRNVAEGSRIGLITSKETESLQVGGQKEALNPYPEGSATTTIHQNPVHLFLIVKLFF